MSDGIFPSLVSKDREQNSAGNPILVQTSDGTNGNSELNPQYVYQVNTVSSGNEIHDFDESVDIAVDASANHDYTIAGTTFILKGFSVSGSGSYKYEVQVGELLSLATVYVGFSTGRQGDTDNIILPIPVEVLGANDGTVRIIKTNRQGTAVSIYSTIIGSDVA